MRVRCECDYPTVSRPIANPMPNINKRRMERQVGQGAVCMSQDHAPYLARWMMRSSDWRSARRFGMGGIGSGIQLIMTRKCGWSIFA